MNCDKCMCNYGRPYAIHPIENRAYKDVDTNCPAIKFIRTKDSNYYVCHKCEMPNEPTGWFPGRGY